MNLGWLAPQKGWEVSRIRDGSVIYLIYLIPLLKHRRTWWHLILYYWKTLLLFPLVSSGRISSSISLVLIRSTFADLLCMHVKEVFYCIAVLRHSAELAEFRNCTGYTFQKGIVLCPWETTCSFTEWTTTDGKRTYFLFLAPMLTFEMISIWQRNAY